MQHPCYLGKASFQLDLQVYKESWPLVSLGLVDCGEQFLMLVLGLAWEASQMTGDSGEVLCVAKRAAREWSS